MDLFCVERGEVKDGIRVRVEVGLVVTDGCTGGLCSWIGSPAAGVKSQKEYRSSYTGM